VKVIDKALEKMLYEMISTLFGCICMVPQLARFLFQLASCLIIKLGGRFIVNVDIGKWAIDTLVSAKIIPHLFKSSYHGAADIWPDLSRRCGLSYPAPSELKILTPASMPAEVQYALRHAMTSYPAFMLTILGALPASFAWPFCSTSSVLKYCFGVESEDIADYNKQQTTDQPSFYLCVDKNMKRIVVSVRGTVPWNIFDVLTDLSAKPASAECNRGEVHGGMLKSAEYVLRTIEHNARSQQLLSSVKDDPEYEMIFCGHSLGAGVAALMAYRLLHGGEEHFPKIAKWAERKKLKVFAFASPCVASSRVVQSREPWNDMVTSIALTTDLVTRISVWSAETLDKRLEIVENWDEMDEDLLVQQLKAAGSCDDESGPCRMYPLGAVMWCVPNEVLEGDSEIAKAKSALQRLAPHTLPYGPKHREKYSASHYTLCELPSGYEHKEVFQNLIFNVGLLYAHLPHRYLWACGVTLKQQ